MFAANRPRFVYFERPSAPLSMINLQKLHCIAFAQHQCGHETVHVIEVRAGAKKPPV